MNNPGIPVGDVIDYVVNLIHREEGTTVEKLPPSFLPMGMSMGNFLD